MKRIEAIVETDGTLCIEYIGFQGQDCRAEAESLVKVLSYYGVDASEFGRRLKSEEEIELEIGQDGATGQAEGDAGYG